ncbi:hypothetical protein SAMN05216249_11079 [Acetitomaculum ruminis DSM 5522]|uniref:PD-(D/E)XK nuclease family transposase n=1 Tax=Acetitomaculum ruminis DSM 5522 TaxID=1120918 RepID=A0A1I0YKP7_9FIRM|nr:hypothetical protein [Acetitomaculum ruminis]SFB13771.1 hypothetical protein SAMN05216249_11079 [Acetitomaculum ruminis DSM 5522]
MTNKDNSYIDKELSLADLKAQYDANVKRLLSDKEILAFILINTIKEFKDYSIKEAKKAIEGDVKTDLISVRPSKENLKNAFLKDEKGKEYQKKAYQSEKIFGLNTESKIPGEGRMNFDIVFTVRTIKGERQKIYINLEAQKDFYLGYDLVTRSIVYCSRLISEQMDYEYDGSNYDGVKKVYSIWICMNSPIRNANKEKVSDTIVEYSISPKVRYNDNRDEENVAKGRFDLLTSIFINLTDKETNSKNRLIAMLSTLLSKDMPSQTKKKELESNYNIKMTKELEGAVAKMCNLSDLIVEDAIKEERERSKKIEEHSRMIEERSRMIEERSKKLMNKKDREIRMLRDEIARLKAMNKKS